MSPESASSPSTETTSIAFDDHSVLVVSNIPEVHRHVRSQFALMLGDSSRQVSTLKLLQNEREYVLEGRAFNPIELAKLDHLLFLLKDEVRLEFMRARPDLLWLHAGAAERDGRAMLILGASGQGKSTLTMGLCESGWRLLSDDVVPISMHENIAYSFPQTPSRRLPSDSKWEANDLVGAARVSLDVGSFGVADQPVPIGEIIFPHYQRGASSSITRLTKGESTLEMIRGATNFSDHKAEAVARCAEMSSRIPAYRVVYGNSADACNLLLTLRNG